MTMTKRVIVNCETGEAEERALTTDERAQADADTAAVLAAQQAETTAASQQAADAQAWRDAVSKASSIADIKALLLGTNTPVRPVVDRKP